MIAVSESTPGPILVNLATYIGSSQAGFCGAVIATLAVIFPSFSIILLVVAIALLKNALKNKCIQAVLRGLKPYVIGVVLATVVIAYKHITEKKISPIMLIIISAFLGMIMYSF